MTEHTPTDSCIRNRYALWGKKMYGTSWDNSMAEFDRFLDAHDKGIRDAVKPPEMTAREHLEAAFEAAYPVPKWRDVQMGVPVIVRWEDGEIRVHAMGSTAKNRVTNDYIEVRTLDPLPPAIPDDCMVVRASCEDTPRLGRTIWQRSNDAKKWFALDPADGAWYEEPLSDLINPVPVPEEES